MKKKVLIVGAFPPPGRKIFGGVVTDCRSLMGSSFSSQFQLAVVDSTQVSNPAPPFMMRLLLSWRKLAIFTYRIIAFQPDVALIFASAGASFFEKGIMAFISRTLGIPVLLRPVSGKTMDDFNGSLFSRFISRFTFQNANYVICQGLAWQDFLVNNLGFRCEQAPIVPQWTATNDLLVIGERRAIAITSKKPRLLFIAWLEADKGIFELLNATLVLSRKYDFELTITGRGHAEAEAKTFVQANGLQHVVEFAGWVDGESKAGQFAGSDILVLPSWAEGFPNAIIEAMAAKVAVVVTSVGNIPSLITDGAQALLIPPRNVKALELAIERLLVDQQLRIGLAERGYAFARDNFSVEQGVVKLTAVIDAATAQIKDTEGVR